jgi:hypothetical protein
VTLSFDVPVYTWPANVLDQLVLVVLDTHALAFVHALCGVRASRPSVRALPRGTVHPREYMPWVKSAETVLRMGLAYGS